jgi:hypothetical protein
VLDPHGADLNRLVEAMPDFILAELQTELQRRCGVRAGPSTIHHALRRTGLRHKKRSLRAAEQDPRATSPASAGCGALGSATWTRPGSSSSTRPAPPPIWHGATAAVRSESASGRAARHWRTTTFIAGLKQTGIVAPLVLAGPWRARLSGLRRAMPGAGARAQRCRHARQISPRIRSTHPPGGRYGRCHAPLPVAVFADLNPIEHDLMGWTAPPFGDGSLHRAPPWHSDAGSGGRPSHQVKQVFAKLKGPLRKVAARTKEELWSTCSTPAPPPKAPTICATATMDSVLRARFAKISVRILARLPGRAYSGNSI